SAECASAAALARSHAALNQARAASSEGQPRTSLSMRSKSMSNPAGANAPVKNQSTVWATCAISAAAVNMPAAGAKPEFSSFNSRVERLKYSRLTSTERAISAGVIFFLLGGTTAGYPSLGRKKSKLIFREPIFRQGR